jgi:hypothetical protein
VREHEIESRYYRVTVDPDTGAVTSLFDKVLERELVDPTAAYGLHQVLARHPRDGRVEPGASAAVCTGEAGAVLCSLVVRGSAPGCPQLTQEITLYDRLKRVDFATRVLRDSTPHLELYAAFPFAVAQPHFRCETTNATFEPVRDQLPGTNTAAYTVQNWVTVSDPAGFGIAWSSLEAPVVSLGQLWPSPISQAHHGIGQPGFDDPFLSDPAGFGPGHLYACLMTSNFRTNFQPTQASEALFRFTLTSAVPAELARRARQAGWGAALPLHPVCLPTGLPCAGDAAAKAPLALVGSFVAIDQPNVQLLALKAAEDGAGVIARLVETEGRETEASLTLPYIEIGQACLTDLVERDLGALAAGRHTVRVHVPSCGMVTVRCRGAGRWPQPKALFCQ